MRSSSSFLFVVPLVIGAGCSASVQGEIDGETVPSLFSAFFIQDKTEVGDTTFFSVAGSGVSLFNACDAAAKRQQAINEACKQNIKDEEDAGTNIDDHKKASKDYVEALVDYDV